jgi:hypothetical protein
LGGAEESNAREQGIVEEDIYCSGTSRIRINAPPRTSGLTLTWPNDTPFL